MDERSTLERQQTVPQVDVGETVPGEPSRAGLVAVDAAAGAAAGAVAGIIAGPPGVALGAVLGGVVGAAAGVALGKAGEEERRHDEQLDREIGVIGGNLGEAMRSQQPTVARLHAASLGILEGSLESSDGPMQNVAAASS